MSRSNRTFYRMLALVHSAFWSLTYFLIILPVTGHWLSPWWYVAVFCPLPWVVWQFQQLLRALNGQPYRWFGAWYAYRSGYSCREISARLERYQQREDTRKQLLGRTEAVAPELLPRVNQLLEEQKFLQVEELLARAEKQKTKEAESRHQQQENLRQAAAKAGCQQSIEPLLAEGKFREAQAALDRCAALMSRAKALGIEAQTADLIGRSSSTQFSEANQLLKDTQEMREQEKLLEALEDRLRKLDQPDQEELWPMMHRLSGLRYGCREFRIALHDFELELAKLEQ